MSTTTIIMITTMATMITMATITTGGTGTTGSSSDGRAGGEAVRSSGRRPSCIGRTPVLPDG
jgi:hypothetical protein